ncbi:MAG: hypothetical protein J5486_04875 [Bacteroidaceae bacterium]|nr:hypothetical protein [Bacteroidaceae bacterium]
MKRLLIILLAGVGVCMNNPVAAQNTMQTCEYWFDYDFQGRKSVALSGNNEFSQQFDLSELPRGLHSIGLRFQDSNGLWGAPLVRHFVIPSAPLDNHTDNAIVSMEYWLDYDFEHRTALANDNGVVEIALDFSALPSGLHSIAYRALDKRGIYQPPVLKHFVIPDTPLAEYPDNAIVSMEYWLDYDVDHKYALTNDNGAVELSLDLSALMPGVHSITYRAVDVRGIYMSPVVKHFVVPSIPEPAVTGIAAYEYWFNYGPRKRIEVDPAVPTLVLTDEQIDITDVVPNSIPSDYRFDTDTETVYVDDNVFFGIQAFDDAGHPSGAVLSDKFAMTVPVNPQMITLETADPIKFAAPRKGHIQGFKSECNSTDSLTWVVSQASAFTAYDVDGNRLQLSKTKLNDGNIVYSAQSPTTTVYALIHDVSEAVDSMTITYIRTVPTSIEHSASAVGSEVTYDLNGRRITQLRRGVNIVRTSDGSVRKVMVH